MDDVYSHGHHDSVLRSHRWRTAENSAAYVLSRLRNTDRVVDVGCGPGTISLALARRVGHVLGVDRSVDVIAQALAARTASGARNVEFRVGDAYALELDTGSFDVVHAHQVLQHLTDPVAALSEWRRVLGPGGLLAARDSDYGAFVWWPRDDRLARWLSLYHELTARNGAEADAGRALPAWVRAAGYEDIEYSSSTWTFAEPDARMWWGDLWAERVERSSFADQTIAYGLSDADELADLAAAWRTWAGHPDATFIVVHGEVLARNPG